MLSSLIPVTACGTHNFTCNKNCRASRLFALLTTVRSVLHSRLSHVFLTSPKRHLVKRFTCTALTLTTPRHAASPSKCFAARNPFPDT
jgi:hypothetical protein